MRLEDTCTRPLEESKRIDIGSTQGTNTGPMLVAWLNAIKRHMISTGIDSMAYVLKPVSGALCKLDHTDVATLCTEINLFKDWGQVSLQQVEDCPDLKPNSESGGNGDGKPVHPSKVPPKGGEPHKKTIKIKDQDVEVKWCGKCTVWRSGKKAHLTEEHVAKETTQPAGGLTYGPFASLCNAETPADANQCFLSKLYAKHPEPPDDVLNGVNVKHPEPPDDVLNGDAEEATLLDSDTSSKDWTTVPIGKGTPLEKAAMDPKGHAGRK
jgi:hypothetical protein